MPSLVSVLSILPSKQSMNKVAYLCEFFNDRMKDINSCLFQVILRQFLSADSFEIVAMEIMFSMFRRCSKKDFKVDTLSYQIRAGA